MDDSVASGGGAVDALSVAMDLLEELPPAGPRLRALGYSSEVDLIGGLADPDAEIRRGCLELLDDAWADAAAPRVIERLDDPEWVVRYNAVHALTRGPEIPRRAPGSAVLPAVIRTANHDSSLYVRMLAIEVIGDAASTDATAADALAQARDHDTDVSVRRKATRCARGTPA